MKFKRTILVLCASSVLAACTTVGKSYPFPHDSEPSSELQIQGKAVYLLTLNDKGCYAGKTYVDGGPGAMPVRVVPDKPLVISYEENACMLPATFTPQKDARYRLIAVEGHKPSDPGVPFLQSMMHIHDRQCVVSVVEMDADGQSVKPVKLKGLRPQQTGFTCIKFR